jgi:hypothetical protein
VAPRSGLATHRQSVTSAGVASSRGAALSASVAAAGPLFDDLLLDVAPPGIRVPVGLARLAAALPVVHVVVVGRARTQEREGEHRGRYPRAVSGVVCFSDCGVEWRRRGGGADLHRLMFYYRCKCRLINLQLGVIKIITRDR